MYYKTFAFFFILLFSISIHSQVWKTYPFTPTDSQISFSIDEGRHVDEPIEWWYTVGHLVGETTGKNYSYMLTYFHFPLGGNIDGFRILNISDDDNGVFFDDTQLVSYTTLATDKLDIQALLLNGNTETWKNKFDGANILPFQYEINASSENVTLDLDYDTNKNPLILGDDGFLLQGETNYTYYYSQTGIEATGTITYNGITENVTGTAWIDRQYGTLNPSDGTEYEWFSLQLSNNMDINLWNIFTENDEIPNDEKFKILAAYVDETTQYTNFDFELERLQFAYTPDNQRAYAQQWRLTSNVNNLDLIITTLYSDSEVQNPFQFYEGTITITGSVNGVDVTGYGFAELLHTYDIPEIMITTNEIWNQSIPFEWNLNNPDDGNPLHYILEYSTNNQTTYTQIVSDLTNQTYLWNNPPTFSNADTIWLKVTGHSIDNTIVGSTTKEFTYDATANVLNNEILSVEIFPNPASNLLEINAENIESVQIFDLNGKLIKMINKNKVETPIDIKNLAKGIYSVKIKTNLGLVIKKLIIK